MRYMIIVKGNASSECGTQPDAELMAAMASYHEDLARAGVLLDAAGLHPTSQGWRVRYGADGSQTVVDGPFTETKEVVGGYTLIQVRSAAEAREWTRRFPAPFGAGQAAEIEVRRLFELDDFEPGEALDRFRALESGRS